MPLKAFKSFVIKAAEITGADFGIIDETGAVLACSNKDEQSDAHAEAVGAMADLAGYFRIGEVSYFKFPIRDNLDYIIFLKSKNKNSKKILELAALNVKNIKLSHEEKYDKAGLIKAILADKILPGDIPAQAKKLQLDTAAKWIVFLVKTPKDADAGTREVIQNLFPDRSKNIIFSRDDSTVLVKQVREKESASQFEEYARSLVDTLNTELMVNAKASIGAVAGNLGAVGRSFREAQAAQRIGNIFESEKTVVNYEKLGLGRLIYDLPESSSNLFVREVFKENAPESLDNETLITIQKLFENNLNISETARLLYIHRNTLIYRLEKIKKATGLDLREFDDAVAFKIAMLVKRNLDKNDALINNIHYRHLRRTRTIE